MSINYHTLTLAYRETTPVFDVRS